VDCVACGLVALLCMGLFGLAMKAVQRAVLLFPGFSFGVVVAAGLVVGFSWYYPGGLPLSLGFVGLQGVLGGALASVLFGRKARLLSPAKAVPMGLLAMAVWVDFRLYRFLSQPGTDAHLALVPEAVGVTGVGRLSEPNPGEPGGYRVREVTYGGGVPGGRREYGRGAVFGSRRVDGRVLLGGSGWTEPAQRTFERVWGFGLGDLPLNGRVWFPDEAGAFPLVMIVHGNHAANAHSEEGYGYLAEGLASRGYVVVSVDENFLNSTVLEANRGEPAARAWLLLEHLRQWREWVRTPGHLMAGRVDFGRVVLVGHSRGGEAVVTAALFNGLSHYPEDARLTFDYGFGIQAVVAVAPVDGQYDPVGRRKHLHNVSYLVLQGAHDLQQPAFAGDAQYARTSFEDGRYRFKAEVYADRADHCQFNTVWGRGDFPGFSGWMVNVKPVMSGVEQRRVARVCIGGFLDAAVKGRHEYVPMFRDPRKAWSWLPDAAYVTRFEDSTLRLMAGFEEDEDLNTATADGGRLDGERLRIWREQRVQTGGRGEDRNTAVCVGWNVAGASYSVQLPAGGAARWMLGTNDTLQLAAAVLMGCGETAEGRGGIGGRMGGSDVDLTVELVDEAGVTARLPLSRLGPLRAGGRAQLLKWEYLDRKLAGREPDPVLQTFCASLGAFVAEAPTLALDRLVAVRFRFDRCALGLVLLDDIGFAARL
jgi:dienelactone hydrolase